LVSSGRPSSEKPLVLRVIEAAAAERVAAEEPPRGENGPAKYAEAPDRLYRVLGAARVVPAPLTEERREEELVRPYRGDGQRAHG
jgi:hypothetical protein